MKASVIIPTYNGSKKIINILHSLEKQNIKDFEVIVIIDGSTDDTIHILNTTKFNIDNIKFINQENQGRGKARNTGVNIAVNDIIIFFDDDIVLEPDCVALHLSHHQKQQGNIIIGVTRMDIHNDPNNDFYNYRYSIEDNWHKPYMNKITRISFEKYVFTTANMSVSKSTFNKIGGFDNRLNDSEDFDFSIKALLQNVPIYFDYSIWSWHCDYADIPAYIKRQKEYLDAKAQLAVLKPEYINLIPGFFSRRDVNSIKRFFSRFFRYNNFWASILNGRLFLLLTPKRIRFALYSKVIFSSSLI